MHGVSHSRPPTRPVRKQFCIASIHLPGGAVRLSLALGPGYPSTHPPVYFPISAHFWVLFPCAGPYTKLNGALYCSPWTSDPPACGSGSSLPCGDASGTTVSSCQALCDAKPSCAAINWFPSWGLQCYMYSSCDTQAASGASGQVHLKRGGLSTRCSLLCLCPSFLKMSK